MNKWKGPHDARRFDNWNGCIQFLWIAHCIETINNRFGALSYVWRILSIENHHEISYLWIHWNYYFHTNHERFISIYACIIFVSVSHYICISMHRWNVDFNWTTRIVFRFWNMKRKQCIPSIYHVWSMSLIEIKKQRSWLVVNMCKINYVL